MRVWKPLLLGATALSLGLVHGDTRAVACAGGSEPVAVAASNPDMPLVRFAQGDLGIVRPTLARSYLVVAYRYLSGLPLDLVEQGGALTLWAERLQLADAKYIDPSGKVARVPEGADAAVKVWQAARQLVPHAPPAAAVEMGYFGTDYSWVGNCLADAFLTAAARLRTLQTEAPDEVASWLAAQDQVFRNCNVDPHATGQPGTGPVVSPSIPSPLPGSARPVALKDRDYQIAAATLYSGNHAGAERLFTAIGNDLASPYQPRARYLVARAIVRGAPTHPDPSAEYQRALTTLDAVIADPALGSVRAAAVHYRTLVLVHADPAERRRQAGVSLATQHLGRDFEDLLGDYTTLLDRDEAPLALTAPDADRLSAWIGVMKNPAKGAAFERALRIYGKSPSPVWLVAALVCAENARDPRLTPLLDAAIATPASSPAYATLALEWARLSRARGVTDREIYVRLQQARGSLVNPTVSTKNSFVLASARSAPTVSDFVANAALTPAGETGSYAVPEATFPATNLTPTVPPDVAALMQRLPLGAWQEAALSPNTPPQIRGEVSLAAWVRAELLHDLGVAHTVAPVVERENPAIAAVIAKVDTAPNDDERRIVFLEALLRAPRLGPDVDAWEVAPTATEPIVSSSAGYLWCKVDVNAGASPAAFLSEADRTQASTETRALSALGSGPTFVASEAAAIAAKSPTDPRVPELLHLAVRATRFGCHDDNNTASSRAAFEALHKGYPHSEWTKKTPYYF